MRIPGYEIELIPLFALILAEEGTNEKLRVQKFQALKSLKAHLTHYEHLGYLPQLLNSIAKKKGDLIIKATTKDALEKLSRPRCPHYNGNRFVPDAYCIPEEELICWSEASLKAPLNAAGYKRYLALFQEVLPDQYRTLFAKGAENE